MHSPTARGHRHRRPFIHNCFNQCTQTASCLIAERDVTHINLYPYDSDILLDTVDTRYYTTIRKLLLTMFLHLTMFVRYFDARKLE